MRLGIIGTAGRQEPLTAFHWRLMLDTALEFANETGATELISGGAAGADHAAVRLFLNDPERWTLSLELAAPFADGRYVETGKPHWRDNPGRVLNHYHDQFGNESLDDLAAALEHPNCTARVDSGGLHGRNTRIARTSQVLLAMTFTPVTEGGTGDTCRKYLAHHGKRSRLHHLDLNTGILKAHTIGE